MKTYSLIAIIAALVAFVLSPLSIELFVSLLFVVGLGSILLHDYVREDRIRRRFLAPLIEVQRGGSEVIPAFELAA
jgi:hypothetical protein